MANGLKVFDFGVGLFSFCQTDSNSFCQAVYFWLRFFADGLVWVITSRKSAVVIVSSWIMCKLLLPKDMRIE